MGIEHPLGKQITYKGRTGQIIGIMKDFHHNSFHSAISPFIFELYTGPSYICIKMKPDHIPETIAFIEKKWNEYVPGRQFSYLFFDDLISNYYHNEKRFTTLAQGFTTFTVFISCLGLLGLALFMVEKRTKEIGIRKVLGASVPGVFYLLCRDFISWICLANIVAWPVAWYAMNRWLQNFAYRINIELWMFVLAGAMTLVIALITISWQAVRAARANPVEALRYE